MKYKNGGKKVLLTWETYGKKMVQKKNEEKLEKK